MNDEELKTRYRNKTTERLQSINVGDRNWNTLSDIVRNVGEEELGANMLVAQERGKLLGGTVK